MFNNIYIINIICSVIAGIVVTIFSHAICVPGVFKCFKHRGVPVVLIVMLSVCVICLFISVGFNICMLCYNLSEGL